jgi:hypothetical protein
MAKLTITIEENPSADGSQTVNSIYAHYDPQDHPSDLLTMLTEPLTKTIIDFINAAYGEPEESFYTMDRDEAEEARAIFQAGGSQQSH